MSKEKIIEERDIAELILKFNHILIKSIIQKTKQQTAKEIFEYFESLFPLEVPYYSILTKQQMMNEIERFRLKLKEDKVTKDG